jgi:hypothetical protein
VALQLQDGTDLLLQDGTALELQAEAALSPPLITQEPQDVTVFAGTGATFTVEATSGATILYQWYEVSAGLLVGETSSTLSIPAEVADSGNEYYCILSNEVAP